MNLCKWVQVCLLQIFYRWTTLIFLLLALLLLLLAVLLLALLLLLLCRYRQWESHSESLSREGFSVWGDVQFLFEAMKMIWSKSPTAAGRRQVQFQVQFQVVIVKWRRLKKCFFFFFQNVKLWLDDVCVSACEVGWRHHLIYKHNVNKTNLNVKLKSVQGKSNIIQVFVAVPLSHQQRAELLLSSQYNTNMTSWQRLARTIMAPECH